METNGSPVSTDTASKCASYETSLHKTEVCSKIGSAQPGRQAVNVAPKVSTFVLTENQSEEWLGEAQRSQVIKTEPCQDQDEELYSLSDLARHFQSSPLTQHFPDGKQDEPINHHKGDLVIHGKRHEIKRPCHCDQSSESSTSPSLLAMHQKTQTIKYSHSSNNCNQAFSESGILVKQNRTHTGEKPYSCDQCNKSFSQSRILLQHKETRSCEKPYSRDQSNKSFRESGSLLKHKRTCSGKKPHSCDQ